MKSKKLKFLYSDAHFFSDNLDTDIQAVNVNEIKAFYVKRCGEHYNVVAITKDDEKIVIRSIFEDSSKARLYIDSLVAEINGLGN